MAYATPDQTLRGYHQVQYQEVMERQFVLTEDYVIIDRRLPARVAAGNHYYESMGQVRSLVADNPDFTRVLDRDGIELYVRNSAAAGTAEPSGAS